MALEKTASPLDALSMTRACWHPLAQASHLKNDPPKSQRAYVDGWYYLAHHRVHPSVLLQ
jgi:hypothetical protein